MEIVLKTVKVMKVCGGGGEGNRSGVSGGGSNFSTPPSIFLPYVPFLRHSTCV